MCRVLSNLQHYFIRGNVGYMNMQPSQLVNKELDINTHRGCFYTVRSSHSDFSANYILYIAPLMLKISFKCRSNGVNDLSSQYSD